MLVYYFKHLKRAHSGYLSPLQKETLDPSTVNDRDEYLCNFQVKVNIIITVAKLFSEEWEFVRVQALLDRIRPTLRSSIDYHLCVSPGLNGTLRLLLLSTFVSGAPLYTCSTYEPFIFKPRLR